MSTQKHVHCSSMQAGMDHTCKVDFSILGRSPYNMHRQLPSTAPPHLYCKALALRSINAAIQCYITSNAAPPTGKPQTSTRNTTKLRPSALGCSGSRHRYNKHQLNPKAKQDVCSQRGHTCKHLVAKKPAILSHLGVEKHTLGQLGAAYQA